MPTVLPVLKKIILFWCVIKQVKSDIDEKEKIRCRNVAKWIDMTTFTQYFLT